MFVLELLHNPVEYPVLLELAVVERKLPFGCSLKISTSWSHEETYHCLYATRLMNLKEFTPMRILFAFLLIIHFIYICSTKARLFWKQLFSNTPKPLQAPRRRIPKHLAVVFIIDPNIYADTVQTALIESALNIIDWCQTTGIPKLTLYEEHGA
jgi:hypothetical protein